MTHDVAALVHLCPDHGKAVTPCCGALPFELPRTDRITLNPDDVTCGRFAARRIVPAYTIHDTALACASCRYVVGHAPTCPTHLPELIQKLTNHRHPKD